MNKFYLSAFILLIFSLSGLSADNFHLNSSGLDITVLHNNLENRFSWSFSTENIKKMFCSTDIRLVIPIAVSNDLQRLEKLSVTSGLSPEKFAVDYYGNVYLLCRSVKASDLPDSVTVEMKISTNISILDAPKDYYYPFNISTGLLSAVFSGTDLDSQAEIKDVLKIIEDFKIGKNSSSETEISRIYNSEASFNYLNDNETFIKHASELSDLLRKTGCGSRISSGYFLPEKLDTFFPGYLLEIFIPGRAVLVLDRKLEILNNSSNFIQLFSGKTSMKPEPFIGVISGNEFYKPKGTLFLRSSVINSSSNPNDTRYDNLFLKFVSLKAETFDISLYFAGSADSYYLLFPLYAADRRKKIFYIKAVQNLVENVKLAEEADKSGNPAEEKLVYSAGDKIYSTVYFKGTGYDKTLTMTWKDPSGEIFISRENSVNASWRSYYRVFSVNEKTRKGTWILEIYLNGILEARKEFTVE